MQEKKGILYFLTADKSKLHEKKGVPYLLTGPIEQEKKGVSYFIKAPVEQTDQNCRRKRVFSISSQHQ